MLTDTIIIIILQTVSGRHLHFSLHIWEKLQECSTIPERAAGVFRMQVVTTESSPV